MKTYFVSLALGAVLAVGGGTHKAWAEPPDNQERLPSQDQVNTESGSETQESNDAIAKESSRSVDKAQTTSKPQGDQGGFINFFRTLFGSKSSPSDPDHEGADAEQGNSTSQSTQDESQGQNETPDQNKGESPSQSEEDNAEVSGDKGTTPPSDGPPSQDRQGGFPADSLLPERPGQDKRGPPQGIDDLVKRFQEERKAILEARQQYRKDYIDRLKDAVGQERQKLIEEMKERHQNWLEHHRDLRQNFQDRLQEIRDDFKSNEMNEMLDDVEKQKNDMTDRIGED